MYQKKLAVAALCCAVSTATIAFTLPSIPSVNDALRGSPKAMGIQQSGTRQQHASLWAQYTEKGAECRVYLVESVNNNYNTITTNSRVLRFGCHVGGTWKISETRPVSVQTAKQSTLVLVPSNYIITHDANQLWQFKAYPDHYSLFETAGNKTPWNQYMSCNAYIATIRDRSTLNVHSRKLVQSCVSKATGKRLTRSRKY